MHINNAIDFSTITPQHYIIYTIHLILISVARDLAICRRQCCVFIFRRAHYSCNIRIHTYENTIYIYIHMGTLTWEYYAHNPLYRYITPYIPCKATTTNTRHIMSSAPIYYYYIRFLDLFDNDIIFSRNTFIARSLRLQNGQYILGNDSRQSHAVLVNHKRARLVGYSARRSVETAVNI